MSSIFTSRPTMVPTPTASIRPMLEPPPGVVSNFDDPSMNLGWQIVLSTAITLPIAIFVCSLRLYTRIAILRNFSADDYLLLLAIASAFMFQAANLISVNLGLGKNAWDIPFSQQIPILKWFLATELTYFVAICFCKLSILAFYLRFILNKFQKYVIWGTLGAVVIYNIVTILVFIFACKPIEATWNWAIPEDEQDCLNVDALYFINAALNCITDIAILILPLKTLWRLKLPLSQKIGLCVIFVTGGFVIIITILRMVQLVNIPDGGRNITMAFTEPSLWSVVEVNLSLFCASVPALKPFVVRYFGRYFSRWTSGSGTKRYGNSGNITGSRAIELGSNPGTGNQNSRKPTFYNTSTTETTTEITAWKDDEKRLVEPNVDVIDIERGSQSSIGEEGLKDLRIMKTSNVRVDSARISSIGGIKQ